MGWKVLILLVCNKFNKSIQKCDFGYQITNAVYSTMFRFCKAFSANKFFSSVLNAIQKSRCIKIKQILKINMFVCVSYKHKKLTNFLKKYFLFVELKYRYWAWW